MIRLFLVLAALFLCSCYTMPLDRKYAGPSPRPPALEEYYGRNGETYGSFKEETLREDNEFTLKRITIESSAGPITIDYYKRAETSDRIILVFPVLGGKPVIESYFAEYFADHGIDSAIVTRQNDFKNPDNIDRLEEIIRNNVVRDRFALDFLGDHYGKKQFASFGISRGAINAAITAGIDERLKHNVLVLGGSDLAKLFEKSSQGRIKKYINTVTAKKNISKAEFFASLAKDIKTDPKNFASYIDARNTLMILGLFDTTVPIKFGRLLREQIGNPKTIFLLSDHYTGLMFTRFLPVLPVDYIESEAMNFYRNSMNTGEKTYKLWPLRVLQLPFDILGRLGEAIF